MCGIAGYIIKTDEPASMSEKLQAAQDCIAARGPDDKGSFIDDKVGFTHRRLSIIDLSKDAAQPMRDGDYVLSFNGEIYNYKELKESLLKEGVSFRTESDTEVLLKLFQQKGIDCLELLNGFFAFSIYDIRNEVVYLVRDRMGIKPLYYYEDDKHLFFGSELKSLIALGVPKTLNKAALHTYLQLNYIPAPYSIFSNVKKLDPGCFLKVHLGDQGNTQCQRYYDISQIESKTADYQNSQKTLHDLLDDSVQSRLVSDVPLGSFLSGGLDSSIIAALASQHVNKLKTFSIGYRDEPHFDETNYAELVAKKIGSDHHVFKLGNDDLFSVLHEVLDYMSEPFADSSALAVYILSRNVRKHVTVALSGDGADELFGGYNKHRAHYKAHYQKAFTSAVKLGSPIWSVMPKSRQSKIGNLARQLDRFAVGSKLNDRERYWRWASFISEDDAMKMQSGFTAIDREEYAAFKNSKLQQITSGSMNQLLLTDCKMVLPDDMLTKVDLMSMANSLEVRVPFLDHRVVNHVLALPSEYKIDNVDQKKILADTFSSLLPSEVMSRSKHGFEVPLLKWFRSELKSMITDDLLSDEFIIDQGLFDLNEIKTIKRKLFSNDPGEVHARIWGLIVFQSWWKKYFA